MMSEERALFRSLAIALALVGASCAHMGQTGGQGTFALRASHPVGAFPGVPVLLTASLDGDEEVEATYCPRIVWRWPDGTESAQEGDCPAFADRAEYPRRWTRWISLGRPGEYAVSVRWEKAGRTIGWAEVTLRGLGGE